MSNLVHPSVLIIAGHGKDQRQNGPSEIYSGSGFILDARNGIVATSSSWLSGLLSIEPANLRGESAEFQATVSREAMLGDRRRATAMKPNSISGRSREFNSVRWELKSRKPLQLQVLLQNQEGASLHHQKTGTIVSKSARILGLYPMAAVTATLAECLSSLSHWRCSAGQVQSGDGEASTAVVKKSDLKSLLLPLSCLVLVQLEDIENIRALHVEFTCRRLQLGESVSVTGTPFGSFCPEVFLAAQSVGCVSKLLGGSGAVFLTDARCLPGCEGAMVVGRRSPVSSSLEMVGMVLSPLLTATGSASGLGLACCMSAMMRAVQRHLPQFAVNSDRCSQTIEPKSHLFNRVFPVVVAVEAGSVWGSGIILTPSTVLTCGHVVQGTTKRPIVIRLSNSTNHIEARVLISSKIPDVAVLQLKSPIDDSDVLRAVSTVFDSSNKGLTLCDSDDSQSPSSDASEGSHVFVTGHGFQDPGRYTGAMSPTVTGGVISKIVRWEGRPVMLMTTAVVHSGMSGGLLVCAATGRPLGMAVSNSLDIEGGFAYPDVSYCIPFSWILLAAVLKFSQSRGNYINSVDLPPSCDGIEDIWKLKSKCTPDCMLPSKL